MYAKTVVNDIAIRKLYDQGLDFELIVKFMKLTPGNY